MKSEGLNFGAVIKYVWKKKMNDFVQAEFINPYICDWIGFCKMSLNIKKQIDYWINTGSDDLSTAELLIQNKRILHGLFFCHFSIEKAVKAHVARCTSDIPPKSHNLSYLLAKTDLELQEGDKDFCAILMTYQLEGRYPENYPTTPSLSFANDYLQKTNSFFTWLKAKL